MSALVSAGILLSFTAAVLMRYSPDMPLAGGCVLQLAIGWMLEVRETARAGAASYGLRRTA